MNAGARPTSRPPLRTAMVNNVPEPKTDHHGSSHSGDWNGEQTSARCRRATHSGLNFRSWAISPTTSVSNWLHCPSRSSDKSRALAPGPMFVKSCVTRSAEASARVTQLTLPATDRVTSFVQTTTFGTGKGRKDSECRAQAGGAAVCSALLADWRLIRANCLERLFLHSLAQFQAQNELAALAHQVLHARGTRQLDSVGVQ